MSLTFYNTLTRRKEIFKPLTPGKVSMYNCGPTVYNYAHIGNFRAYIFEDLLKRYLKFKGYAVTQVMNLTDVDDKIIKKCAETGRTIFEYTDTYKKAFFRDLETLNIDKAEIFPAAAEHIPEMVALVKKLMERGLAYRASDGNIFFKISAFPQYGKLQHLNRDNLKTGARVENDEYDKEAVNDFALWKVWKPEDGKVYWETELGKGRPGWHIECSAMSMKYLGETFDIHTGGVDNMFPHHENEIAQSEGATGHSFVNYWLHCEHLLWESSKMSKSLGNIIYIDGLLEKGYSPEAIRYTLLSTHYRQKLNFSLNLLDASVNTLKRFDDFLFELQHVIAGSITPGIRDICGNMLRKFEADMDDDLNISAALSAVFDAIREIYRIKREKPLREGDKEEIVKALKKIDSVLGVIFFRAARSAGHDEAFIRRKIEERNAARAVRDWATADRIRDKLAEMGIELLDLKTGTEYKVKS